MSRYLYYQTVLIKSKFSLIWGLIPESFKRVVLLEVQFPFHRCKHKRKSPVIFATLSLSVAVLLIDLADHSLGMGASGTQNGGAGGPKGTNKRRAV